jgi:Protein of unknown function (DUF3025)
LIGGLLSGVDWVQPWLWPYRALAECLRGDDESVADGLNRVAATQPPVILVAGPLRFVPQADLPEGLAYESHIHHTARVPTRDNRHDLFNGLVWLCFPALKRRLNELHAAQIERDGVGSTRGAVRDALTLFDENAALLQAPAVLLQALRERDWHGLFVTHRPAWDSARLTLVGHALLDKLVTPRKAITAHVWLVPEGVDAPDWLAASLTPALLATRQHHPLPVLGVPDWWPANEVPGFYDDAQVFRPLRP